MDEVDIRLRLKHVEHLLSDLYDLQNGPPLPKYEADWSDTMKTIELYFQEFPEAQLHSGGASE